MSREGTREGHVATPTPLDGLGASLPRIVAGPPGPRSSSVTARLAAVESPAFGARREAREREAGDSLPTIVYARGAGSNVVDVDGNVFADLAAGFGALLLGHRPASARAALDAQADELWLALGDLYASEPKARLLERLAALHPAKGARAMLGQSGSDALVAALKTARLATGRPGVVAFEGAYHGLSYGPLSACGLRASWREAFRGQLDEQTTFAPYPRATGDVDRALAATRAALGRGDVGAVLVEPVLGRGGVVVPPPGFLAELRALAREAGALVVADEVWTGLGRAGAWLASVDAGLAPDLVCLGKGLGGGLPLSACVGTDEAMQAWRREPGREVVHTATFHGAPLACATSLALLDEIDERRLVERARDVGARAVARLAERLAGLDAVRAVRGRGLMIGVELSSGGRALAAWSALVRAGWLVTVGGLGGEVVVLTPALDVPEAMLDAFGDALAEIVR